MHSIITHGNILFRICDADEERSPHIVKLDMDRKHKRQIDQCLIDIKNGDKESVTTLHSLIAPTLRHIALKYMRDENSADDLVQEFWGDIFKIATSYVFIQNGFNFLCKIMTRRALNALKKSTREKGNVVYVDYSAIENFAVEQSDELIELRIMIDNAMSKLSDEEKHVIQEIYFEDKTLRAIAAEMGVSKSTVGNLKLSAIKKLKENLSDNELDKLS